ncbi:MAG: hypothetical protein R6U50_04485 [Desulfobacterales bacterium]
MLQVHSRRFISEGILSNKYATGWSSPENKKAGGKARTILKTSGIWNPKKNTSCFTGDETLNHEFPRIKRIQAKKMKQRPSGNEHSIRFGAAGKFLPLGGLSFSGQHRNG